MAQSPPMANDTAGGDGILVVDVDGFEGPLDLLLELARNQKVDLLKISVLRLAEQYAEFIENSRALKINLAADYLVMAAWLALIKSRLLLPHEDETGSTADELASRLAFRLQRLNAMRDSAQAIMGRDQLGKEFFARGDPEQVAIVNRSTMTATVLDLTQAYARLRTDDDFRPFTMNRDPVFSVEAATENLQRLLGETPDWAELMRFLPSGWTSDGRRARAALAATFAAALELARQGRVDLRQSHAFGPIQLKGLKEADNV